jgi:hypothetical protein
VPERRGAARDLLEQGCRGIERVGERVAGADLPGGRALRGELRDRDRIRLAYAGCDQVGARPVGRTLPVLEQSGAREIEALAHGSRT